MSGGGEAPPADPETSEIISASRRTQRVALYAHGIVTSWVGLPFRDFGRNGVYPRIGRCFPVPAQKPIRSGNRCADEDRHRCCDLGTIHGFWAPLHPSDTVVKKNGLTPKRVRLFGSHNSSCGATFVAMM
jgi:hypothetical protein